jgi:hypothetical protein
MRHSGCSPERGTSWRHPRTPWRRFWLAIIESDGLLKLGRLEEATRVGLRGLGDARRHGLASSYEANIAMGNAVEGLLARGCTSDAAALIDPLTTGPLDWVYIALHMSRGEIDLLRGEFDAAAQRLSQIELGTSLEHAFFLGLGVAEVALWAGRPQEALEAVQTVLERLEGSGEVISCGWPLAVGMRACADLAQLGRARGDQPSVQAALVAAEDLTSWVKRERGAPFAEHPFVASIPAERSTWDAEQGRTRGASDPSAWSVAAERWEALGYRHRAGYARWRQAEVLLATPHGGRGAAATVLSTAADLAMEHVPLTTAIQDLARRARIDLSAPVPFISPRTAGVHVTHILRKLDATTRVQAATIADRAGLLAAEPARPGAT